MVLAASGHLVYDSLLCFFSFLVADPPLLQRGRGRIEKYLCLYLNTLLAALIVVSKIQSENHSDFGTVFCWNDESRSRMMGESAGPPQTSAYFYQTTRRHI